MLEGLDEAVGVVGSTADETANEKHNNAHEMLSVHLCLMMQPYM